VGVGAGAGVEPEVLGVEPEVLPVVPLVDEVEPLLDGVGVGAGVGAGVEPEVLGVEPEVLPEDAAADPLPRLGPDPIGLVGTVGALLAGTLLVGEYVKMRVALVSQFEMDCPNAPNVEGACA